MKKLIITCAIFLIAMPAWSLDLKQARMKGFVTEMDTGYLELHNNAAKDLVIEVNKKRKKYYMKISKKNGTSIQEVASRAAIKLKEKHKKKK
jgi:uncharacterized protein